MSDPSDEPLVTWPRSSPDRPNSSPLLVSMLLATVLCPASAVAQEPVSWDEDLVFHTFSIAAVDPMTGESGVAVTTRNACVGNGVPGYRELSQPTGNDVWQVKLIMHALGYYRADEEALGPESQRYDDEIALAVDAFRADQGISHPGSGGTPSGFVDAQAIELMWTELEEVGKAAEIREMIRGLTQARR